MDRKNNKLFKCLSNVALVFVMIFSMLSATLVSADTVDITGPGFESAELIAAPEGGYTSGDLIQLRINAYDTESDIVFISAPIFSNNPDCTESLQEFKGWVGEYSEFSKIGVYQDEDGSYVISDKLMTNFFGENCTIPQITLEDSAGNVTTVNTNISFSVNRMVDENVSAVITGDASEVVLDNNNIRKTIQLNIEVTGNEKEISGARVSCVEKDGSYFYGYATFSVYDNFVSEFEITTAASGLELEFKDVEIFYTDGTSTLVKNDTEYTIKVIDNITDKVAPVIKDVEMDKNGQILEEGYVTIRVTVEDESSLSDFGDLMLKAGVDNATNYFWVELVKVSEGVYEGKVDVEELYNCDWYLYSVGISDVLGNDFCTSEVELTDYWFGVIRDGVYLGKDIPSEPEKPVEPDVPAEQEKPSEVNKLEEEKITETTSKIEDAINKQESNAGSNSKPVEVVVDMKKEDGTIATEVPKEILEAAKGENVDVVLDMGDYSWTINGKDIKAENLEAINLEVKLGTNNIPSEKVKLLANGQKTHQLSLTHNGDFGFKANLTINLGSEKAGQYGNLYYYDSNEKLVFMNSGKIDEDGNVSLLFSHASEYVVVIGEKVVDVPKTGDNTNTSAYITLLFTGLAFTIITMKKKYA